MRDTSDSEAESDQKKRRLTSADIFKFSGLIVFIAVMVIACILLWPYVEEFFEPGGYQNVVNDVRNAGPVGIIIVFVLELIQVIVAFIPGEIVQIVAGLIYGPWLGALIIWVGCVASSALIFLLVHKLGAPFVQSMVPEKYMNWFNRFEERGGLNIVVFLLFLIPGMPKDIFTYITPLTTMRMRTFLLLTGIARIPGIILSTFAASGLMEGNIVTSIILFVVLAAIAIVVLLRYQQIIDYFGRRFGRGSSKHSTADADDVKETVAERKDLEEGSEEPDAESKMSEEAEMPVEKVEAEASSYTSQHNTEPSD